MAAPFFCAGTQGIDGFFHMGCQGIRGRAAIGSMSPKEENPSETYSGRARSEYISPYEKSLNTYATMPRTEKRSYAPVKPEGCKLLVPWLVDRWNQSK